jgi:hypothetical protein
MHTTQMVTMRVMDDIFYHVQAEKEPAINWNPLALVVKHPGLHYFVILLTLGLALSSNHE